MDTSLEPGVFKARVGKACTDLSPVPRFEAVERLPRDVEDGSCHRLLLSGEVKGLGGARALSPS